MNRAKRILVAEDDLNDAELLIMTIAGSSPGTDIVHVKDGEETLDYLYDRGKFSMDKNSRPAALLLDLKMPKVNGIDVLKIVKADENLKTMPIIMFTSSREEQDVAVSYNLGANAYVVKPLSFEGYVEAVNALSKFWIEVNEVPN